MKKNYIVLTFLKNCVVVNHYLFSVSIKPRARGYKSLPLGNKPFILILSFIEKRTIGENPIVLFSMKSSHTYYLSISRATLNCKVVFICRQTFLKLLI